MRRHPIYPLDLAEREGHRLLPHYNGGKRTMINRLILAYHMKSSITKSSRPNYKHAKLKTTLKRQMIKGNSTPQKILLILN